MTWLDIGNGWRNVFLLSCMLQALALGVLFATRRAWMKEHRAAAFFAGVSVTPFAEYLWMLLLSLLWPHAPKLIYIGAPPMIAAGYLIWLIIKHRKRWKALLRGGWQKIRAVRLDRAAIVSVCFALAMGALLMPVCIRTATSAVAAQADSGEYMGLALRYAEGRDTAALFTKADTQAEYRGHSHFPSLELYMAYGLMHTSDVYGYPYDKPMFTGIGLLIFYLLAAFIALALRAARGKLRWLMLALLLFNLIPYLVEFYRRSDARRLAVPCGADRRAAVFRSAAGQGLAAVCTDRFRRVCDLLYGDERARGVLRNRAVYRGCVGGRRGSGGCRTPRTALPHAF